MLCLASSMIRYDILGDWRSWLARLHDTQEVTGSIPVSPTLLKALKSLGQRPGDETVVEWCLQRSGNIRDFYAIS
jgi:hypothetical protein